MGAGPCDFCLGIREKGVFLVLTASIAQEPNDVTIHGALLVLLGPMVMPILHWSVSSQATSPSLLHSAQSSVFLFLLGHGASR